MDIRNQAMAFAPMSDASPGFGKIFCQGKGKNDYKTLSHIAQKMLQLRCRKSSHIWRIQTHTH